MSNAERSARVKRVLAERHAEAERFAAATFVTKYSKKRKKRKKGNIEFKGIAHEAQTLSAQAARRQGLFNRAAMQAEARAKSSAQPSKLLIAG